MYTFKEIIGNEQIIKSIQNAICNNKLSHAYIIDGAQGSGKTLLSNTFAKTIQCETNDTDACCECISCKAFDSNNHPDIIYTKPTKTKSIGVDDIREQIINTVQIKPYKYKYKIFIIEDADKMTVQAQNAILKTIEEPPSYAVFLLLSTNYNSFLPTILSRCTLFKIKPLPEKTVHDYIITNLNVDSNLANILSIFSQGNIGKSKLIVESDKFLNLREQTLNWILDLKTTDIIKIFEIAKEMENYKDDIYDILDMFLIWFRDILMIKNEFYSFLLQKDKVYILEDEASRFNVDSIFEIVKLIEVTKVRLTKNSNFELTLEIMLLKIKEMFND